MPSNSPQEFLAERQHAYRVTFKGPLAEQVLADLAKFCRAEQSCFHEDPRIHAMLEGRREVWLRIQEHLKLDAEELLRSRALTPKPAAE